MATQKREPIYIIWRIAGAALMAFLWYISLVNIGEDWGGPHYRNMHDGPGIWNWIGLVMITLVALTITGWVNLDRLINDYRADKTPEYLGKKDVSTMLIRGGQIVFGIVGFILIAL